MKVVLFCGGMGLRIRDYSDEVPKPMIQVGHRPILWHIMRYYAHFGHRDFILCLGYQSSVIKRFFLDYRQTFASDLVLTDGGSKVDVISSDIADWKITLVDTGLHATIGERLMAVRHHLEGEEMFLANYADCVTDAPLDEIIEDFRVGDRVGSFMSIPPNYTFHIVDANEDGTVTGLVSAKESGLWMNGGFFVLRQRIFDHMEEGDDLVEEPFRRLIKEGLLGSYKYPGFWACMDTFKEREILERMHGSGNAPWEVWSFGNGKKWVETASTRRNEVI